MIEQLGKKLLYHAGPKADGSPRTLLFKGHFLASADVLEARFPDAHFLTIVRDPARRIRSLINFLRVMPETHCNGAIPWPWLTTFAREVEVSYCLREQRWYQSRPHNSTVVRFTDYVADLEGTLTLIYQRCLPNVDPTGYIPTTHAPRQRTNYAINRTLAEVGIDEQALLAPLQSYRQWCRGEIPMQAETEAPT